MKNYNNLVKHTVCKRLIQWLVIDANINTLHKMIQRPTTESFTDSKIVWIRRSSEPLIAQSSTWSLEWRTWRTPLTKEHLHAPIKRREEEEGGVCCIVELRSPDERGWLNVYFTENRNLPHIDIKETGEFSQQIEIQF